VTTGVERQVWLRVPLEPPPLAAGDRGNRGGFTAPAFAQPARDLGTSRSGSELAGKLNRLPDAMVKARKTGLLAAAAKAKPIMQHAPGAASRVGGKTIRVTDRMIGEDGCL
jgi:hypothetical protein